MLSHPLSSEPCRRSPPQEGEPVNGYEKQSNQFAQNLRAFA